MGPKRMTNIEVARETRKQRRLELLGTATPRCGACGFNRWQALELHHMPGRKIDPNFTVTTCRNCHRILSDDQKDHPGLEGDPELAKFGRLQAAPGVPAGDNAASTAKFLQIVQSPSCRLTITMLRIVWNLTIK